MSVWSKSAPRDAARSGIAAACVVTACAGLLFSSMATTARAFEDADIRAMVLNVRTAAEFPGQGGIWMGLDRAVKLDGMGNAEITEHLVARVFDSKWAKERFAPLYVPYWSATQGVRPERVRVWRSIDDFVDLPKTVINDERDPRAGDVKPYAGFRRVRFDLGDLKAGDVVELKWKRMDNVIPGELNVRWARVDFGAAEPVVEQHVSFEIPDALVPSIDTRGPGLMKQREALGEYKRWTWVSGNLAARPGAWLNEVYSRFPLEASPADTTFPYVQWSTSADWKYLSDYFGRRWEGFAAERDAGMSLATSKLVSADASVEKRARSIEAYVQSSIATVDVSAECIGLRPFEAGEIFRAAAGVPRDKCLLLYSMLRGAGLKATPAFVASAPRIGSPSAPVPASRDRLLVRVLTDGSDVLWLDPLESKSELPAGMALLVPPRVEQGPNAEVPFPGRTSAPK